MNLQRIDAKSFLPLGLTLLIVTLAACSTPAVGAPCLPEQVPATGFDDREAYIESSSVQCQTRVCMVFHLRGDPRKPCTPTQGTCDKTKDPMCVADNGKQCSSDADTEARVYCTCRCKAPSNTQFANCACPYDFACVDVLDQGDPGVRGSYCVKKKTYTQ